MSKEVTPEESRIPRFVLSLTDTETWVNDANGHHQFNIGIGADKLSDFTKFIHKRDRKKGNPGRTEFEAMIWWFRNEVDAINKDIQEAKLEFDDSGREQES